jgi:Domain of Unknown Function with PDB structure (DUF3857)
MKKPSLLAFAIFLSISLFAQKKGKNENPDLPPFGKVEKADLEMKQCDFDDKAEAMVLVDDGQLEYIFNRGMVFQKRVRIKILNDKGRDWANVHIRYRSERNLQDISSLEAQTYNLDPGGNIIVTKVEKKLIYDKKINKKYSEKVFTFPEVKVGSIIEYKYKHEGIGLVDWYFQRSIPVKYSHFVIDFPTEIEVNVMPYCSRQYEQKNDEQSTRFVKTYSMSKVPAFRDEPFILNEDHYRDRLETKVIAYNFSGRRENRAANWVQVIKYLMEDEDFGVQLKRNIPRTADLDEMLKNVSNSFQKMKIIYKYVQKNMQWNETYGIWALDGVRSAWKDKKGTVGEINLILVNLLKDADLNAHAVLVSTHDNGVVNTADPGTYEEPGFLQFDKVMAYVEIDKKVYVLDASEKETPVNLFPPDILGTEGLVIEKIETYDWGWRTLWKDDLAAKSLIQIFGLIDESGNMSGEATISSADYARLNRLPVVKKGKDKFIEKYIAAANATLKVEDVEFENVDADSLPLIQKVKFNQPLNSSGDYRYFSINTLSGLETNPFVADNRFSDVFFGYNQNYVLVGNYTLPDGYEVETLPKNIRMIMPDTSISISRVSQLSGSILMTRVSLDFKKPVYPAGQYPEMQEFYKALFDILNEQFVIRKKK